MQRFLLYRASPCSFVPQETVYKGRALTGPHVQFERIFQKMRLSVALLTLLVATGLALPYSAKPNALKATGNIPTVLTQNGLTTLVELVTKAGLAEALSGAGPFTVFAPTNEAFGKLDPATLKAVQMDVNLLKRVLTYHVVGSALPSADIKSELTPKTLAGESLRINVYGNDVTVNGALRVKTLETTNGIVYVIDKVIIPPEAESDIAQVLEKKKEFSTLLTALKVAGLTDTVKSAGPFTLFAPTDAAFKALPAGTLDSLIADPDKLKKILLNHVVSGTVYSRGLPPTADVEVVGGDKVKVLVSTRGVSINKAKVTEADIYATNGVIHVVDEVILPETKAAEPVSTPVVGNIPAVLSQNGFSTLVDMVVKAELAEALSGPGPFTVFAPTNEAFTNVDVATLKALQMDVNLLKRVLTHHVVGSEISPASVKSEATPKTLAGDNLRINTYGKDVTINGALRLKSLETSNGIIYSIDKVLVPDDKERDIAEVLEKTGEFSTLLTALKVAGLKDTIKSAGPFTLFAPTDTAFKALPAGALDSLISNPEELKKVLLNHVVSGTVYSRGLPPTGDVEVVGGGKVPVDVSSRGVKVGSAQVTEADIYATNGVVHIVNSVILPESPKVTQKDSAPAPVEVKNIPKLLTENGQTTLVDLVVKAGLAETLSGPGPFTVFAPTNAAFDAIDPATLKSLLMDVSLLKRVLLDHVVDTAVPASAVKNDLTTKSISCRQLRLNVYGSKVTVNGALRLKTLEASNGVIHVIDKVIIPGDNNVDIPKLLEKKGGFSTLLSALKTTGLDKTLESDGPFTLLAPTDEAFKALPAGALDSLVANPVELKKTLLSHVLGGTAYSRGLSNGKINLARGGSVPVLVNQRDGVKISDAKVIEADISASNGVVHVIDRVI